jgi:hypothetical protein
VAGNGSYPSPAIRRFAGALEGYRPHGSLQTIGTLKGTLMGRAIEGDDGAEPDPVAESQFLLVEESTGAAFC